MGGLLSLMPVKRMIMPPFMMLPELASHKQQLRAREREHELFGEGIHHRERDEVVVKFPVHRIFLEIIQRVVHPAEHPLHVEAETTIIHRIGHFWKGGGFFSNHNGVCKIMMYGDVKL